MSQTVTILYLLGMALTGLRLARGVAHRKSIIINELQRRNIPNSAFALIATVYVMFWPLHILSRIALLWRK